MPPEGRGHSRSLPNSPPSWVGCWVIEWGKRGVVFHGDGTGRRAGVCLGRVTHGGHRRRRPGALTAHPREFLARVARLWYGAGPANVSVILLARFPYGVTVPSWSRSRSKIPSRRLTFLGASVRRRSALHEDYRKKRVVPSLYFTFYSLMRKMKSRAVKKLEEKSIT